MLWGGDLSRGVRKLLMPRIATLTTKSMLVLSSVNFCSATKSRQCFVRSFIISAIVRALLSNTASAQCTQTALLATKGRSLFQRLRSRSFAVSLIAMQAKLLFFFWWQTRRNTGSLCFFFYSFSDSCAPDWSHRQLFQPDWCNLCHNRALSSESHTSVTHLLESS